MSGSRHPSTTPASTTPVKSHRPRCRATRKCRRGHLRSPLRLRRRHAHELLTIRLQPRPTVAGDARSLLAGLLPRSRAAHTARGADPNGLLSAQTQFVAVARQLVQVDGRLVAFYALDTRPRPKPIVKPHVARFSSDLAISDSGPSTAPATPVGATGLSPTFTDTIIVTDHGPDQALGVTLDDKSAGVMGPVVSATPSQGTCQAPASDGTFNCELGTIAPGTPVTVQVTVAVGRGSIGSTYTNTATVSGALPDPNATNNAASAGTSIVLR